MDELQLVPEAFVGVGDPILEEAKNISLAEALMNNSRGRRSLADVVEDIEKRLDENAQHRYEHVPLTVKPNAGTRRKHGTDQEKENDEDYESLTSDSDEELFEIDRTGDGILEKEVEKEELEDDLAFVDDNQIQARITTNDPEDVLMDQAINYSFDIFFFARNLELFGNSEEIFYQAAYALGFGDHVRNEEIDKILGQLQLTRTARVISCVNQNYHPLSGFHPLMISKNLCLVGVSKTLPDIDEKDVEDVFFQPFGFENYLLSRACSFSTFLRSDSSRQTDGLFGALKLEHGTHVYEIRMLTPGGSRFGVGFATNRAAQAGGFVEGVFQSGKYWTLPKSCEKQKYICPDEESPHLIGIDQHSWGLRKEGEFWHGNRCLARLPDDVTAHLKEAKEMSILIHINAEFPSSSEISYSFPSFDPQPRRWFRAFRIDIRSTGALAIYLTLNWGRACGQLIYHGSCIRELSSCITMGEMNDRDSVI